MKFVLKPTLKQMALVKIATRLWNREDIRNLFNKCNFTKDCTDFKNEWQDVEDQVMEKVSHLPSPEPLKNCLLSIIKPIGLQIKAWFKYHRRRQCKIFELPAHFSWTPEGTIDRKRTAEMLVIDEDLDLHSRYKLSCINCLEDKIPELWNEIPEEQRVNFDRELNDPLVPKHVLVKLWTYYLTGQIGKLEEICQRDMGEFHLPHVYAFHCAVEDGNKAATEYFLGKMSEGERNTLLVDYVERAITRRYFDEKSREYYTEVFLFLLSQLSEDQQVQVLVKHALDALLCFLDWPYQPFFMVSADQVNHLITEDDNNEILQSITSKIVRGCTDFDYRQLFRDYWNLIPLDYKRLSIDQFRLLLDLFKCGEEKLLEFVYKDADPIAKRELILSDEGGDLVERLVYIGEWRSLEWIFEQCVPSKEVMVEFKERLMERKPSYLMAMKRAENRPEWEKLLLFLDDLIAQKSEIRKAEGVDDN